MKRKKSVSAKPIPMSITAQALIDLAMGVEGGNKQLIKNAREALSRLGVQIYIGDPIPELAPCDIKLATIPQLIYWLKKQSTAMVFAGLKVGWNGEEWFTSIKGSPNLVCTAFNTLGGKIQQYKPGSNGNEPITIQDC